MKPRPALQLYSVRDGFERDPRAVLEFVAEMGYDFDTFELAVKEQR